MCGISGYYYFDKGCEVSNYTIRRMMSLQKHRGPDDSGITAINTKANYIENISITDDVYFSNASDLIFGFNRLSILDLSLNGHQPMISNDGNIILMMNGEIYNAFDFKNELTNKNYKFKSSTDTEIVLNLYLEYGMDKMIKKLNGMFAIVIYDMKLKTLFIARDRFGIKPLYYLLHNGSIAFSSEMKSFKAYNDFYFEFDESRLNEFLLFRNLVNNTLFKDIKNCTPGTYLSVSSYGDIKENVYYDINDEGIDIFNENRPLLYLEEVLMQSVKRQMISDVKLGVQLSGGVDSSLVSFFASKSLLKGKLETISIIFENILFTEEEYIDQVTEKLNLITHKYILDSTYFFNQIVKATWHFEQPLNHPNSIGIYLLNQMARNHVTVLLSGEGADESLAGYNRFIYPLYFLSFCRNTLSLFKQSYKNISELMKYYFDNDVRLIISSSFSSMSVVKNLKSNFDFDDAIEKRLDLIKKLKGDKLLKHRKYEMLTFLPDLLMRQDKMSMAHSIENRVPFLDNEMVKASLSLPENLLVNRKNGKLYSKILLKELCALKFNYDFAFREKAGFGVPIKKFMCSKIFKDMWFSEILPGIYHRNIFNADYLSSLFNNIDKLSNTELDALWIMTSFEIWAKQYLDK